MIYKNVLSNNTLIHIIFLVILTVSCVAQQPKELTGTLKGTIGIYEGNCMPGPDRKPCEPRPISTEIVITNLTEKYDNDLIVMKVKSGIDGQFEIKLPTGSYSLFLKDGEKMVCTLIQCPSTCLCHPFNISADSITVVDANLDHATW